MPYDQILFNLTNAFLALTATGMAFRMLATDRYMIIKPSFFIGCLMLIASWATVFKGNYIYTFLIYPWHYTIIIPGTNVIILAVSRFSFDKQSIQVWRRATNTPLDHFLHLQHLIKPGIIITTICLAIYFLYVPPWKTGLWAMFTGADSIAVRDAREASLKLLPAIPRYAFAFNREVVAIFMAATLAVIAVAKRKLFKQKNFIKITLLLFFWIVSSMIYGARGPGGMVIGAFILSWLLYKKIPLNPLIITILVIIVLAVPTAISLARKDLPPTPIAFWNEFSTNIIQRAFFTSTRAGSWHIDLVQRRGYWGIDAISKIATLKGTEPINVDNLVMNVYFKSTATGLATVNSYITNYTRFGLGIGCSLTIVLVWALDLIILFYRRIPNLMLIPSICTFMMVVRGVNSSNFETIFITRGLIPGIMLMLLMKHILKKRILRKRFHVEQQKHMNYSLTIIGKI